MKKRYIQLSEGEEEQVKKYKNKQASNRLISRSHALLLSNKGYCIAELAAIFEVRQATIIDWFNRWERQGLEGLEDAKKSGRPRNLREIEKNRNGGKKNLKKNN